MGKRNSPTACERQSPPAGRPPLLNESPGVRPKGSNESAIMELGPKNHTMHGFLGPKFHNGTLVGLFGRNPRAGKVRSCVVKHGGGVNDWSIYEPWSKLLIPSLVTYE